jgi:tetratricopeptide (TPR) repeat protein
VSASQILDLFAPAALTAGVAAALVALLRLPKVARRWLAVRRVYGVLPVTLAMDVWRYAARGSLLGLQRLSLIGFLIGAGALIAASSLEARLGSPVQWGTFSLGCLFLHVVSVLEIATPPAILLLGPSSVELEEELASLNRDLPQYRTVALLKPGEASLAPRSRWSAFSNNFRTRDLYQWRSIVFHLMDVVPVIVLCDDERAPVVEERRRLTVRGYLDRTLITRRELLAGALWAPAERQRLRAWLASRLTHVHDQEARLRRQMEMVRMRTSAPGDLWYPQDAPDMVLKAKRLEGYALTQFLETCKEGGATAHSGILLEDRPSLVSRAEELRYLREDRAFEEIEILLLSAEEGIDESGPYAGFNRANLCNKRGLLARFRGQWELAEQEIRTAIFLFESMTLSPSTDLAAMAFREVGTAYYNLGDVYLARFRETNDPADRDRAQECYELSVDHDQKGGGSTQLARERLRLLQTPG